MDMNNDCGDDLGHFLLKPMKMHELREELISMSTSGDEFKIKFALYMLTALLNPKTNY